MILSLPIAGHVAGWLVTLVLSAHRRPIPAEEWTFHARNVLAAVVESEGAPVGSVDRAAIPWVLARRWSIQRQGWTFAEQARRYSAPVRLGRARVRAVGCELGAWLDAWAAGLIADPCPLAVHWGALCPVSNGARCVPPAARLRVCREARNAFIRAPGTAKLQRE
jgi:hypothetical protein